MEWLHQGCDSDLSVDFINLGAGDFLFLGKVLQNRPFFALAPRSSFGAAISAAILYKKASVCKTSFSKSLLCVKAFCMLKTCCV